MVVGATVQLHYYGATLGTHALSQSLLINVPLVNVDKVFVHALMVGRASSVCVTRDMEGRDAQPSYN